MELHTLGKPLACAPMTVTAFFALNVLFGVYCFTARCNSSSSPSTVARAYSRMWHVGIVCSVTSKFESAIKNKIPFYLYCVSYRKGALSS